MSDSRRAAGVRFLTADEWKLVAQRRLRAADAAPYLSSLLLAMPVYAVPGITAAVDRSARLYLNMEWFENLTNEEGVGLLLHEMGHIIHGHADRAEARHVVKQQRQIWNIAGDLTINDDLIAGGFALPEDGVMCEALRVPLGKTVEAYFDELMSRTDDQAHDQVACGSGAGGQAAEWEFSDADQTDSRGGDADGFGRGLSVLDLDLQRRNVAGEVARHAAKHGYGSVPGSLARWAEELLRPPTIHWRDLLRTTVRRRLQIAAGVDDYTWTRPNRRRRSGNIMLPATFSVIPTVAVVVDTSGSISGDELAGFVSEIVGMAAQFRIQARDVQVIPCDSEAGEPISADKVIAGAATLGGGGGTNMGTGIAAIAALRQRPDLAVVFTDGFTPWPDKAPPFPVVVALSEPSQVETVPGWSIPVVIDEPIV